MENTNQKMVKTGDENPVNRTSTKQIHYFAFTVVQESEDTFRVYNSEMQNGWVFLARGSLSSINTPEDVGKYLMQGFATDLSPTVEDAEKNLDKENI